MNWHFSLRANSEETGSKWAALRGARHRDRARDGAHGGGGIRFYAEYTHAHVARLDSFTSIQALSMAKAVSNDANADESRFIVDPAHAAQYQQAYLGKSQQIVNVGNNVTYARYLPLLNADIAAYDAAALGTRWVLVLPRRPAVSKRRRTPPRRSRSS